MTHWPDYRTWRWHFYAGLFCIPFVIWLATTGSIYLFKPQIERWLDAPYDRLTVSGPPAPPSAHVAAAVATVDGGTLNSYELPPPDGAVRVLVGRGAELYRVYVHPQTSQVLGRVREDERPMRKLFYLHGELAQGARGSMLVEMAASWAVVMLVSGLFLWWPRTGGLAGVVYPRISRGGRAFWRDIHAVAGLWISVYTLFLLTSGLPWAKSWGNLLKQARRVGGDAVARLDWTTGRESEIAERIAMNTPASRLPGGTADAGPAMSDEHAAHNATMASGAGRAGAYQALDRLVPTVTALQLASPVLISPPSQRSPGWTGRSDAANRPLRVTLELDGATGSVLSREDFAERPLIDRLVGIGVAAHEGQLFGVLNQLIGLANAIGLVLVSVTAVVLWWQRRPARVLGAPPALAAGRRALLPTALMFGVALLGLVLPMLGLSLLAVLVLERTVLRRIDATRTFLGLTAA